MVQSCPFSITKQLPLNFEAQGLMLVKMQAAMTRRDFVKSSAAALKAGAHGVIFSRKYSEMRLANLAAAGRAVRDSVK